MTDTIPYPCHLSTRGTEKTVNHRPIRQSTANPYLIPIPVNASDNDDGDEGDEEHVNMAMALLQKLLDGVNISLFHRQTSTGSRTSGELCKKDL